NEELLRPLLTSRSVGSRCPFRHKARSPRVRTHSFTAQPPDIRYVALATRASRLLARSPCLAAPPIRFLFIGSRFTLHASFPRLVTLPQLRFASFAVASLREDLHLQECARAGRTKKTPRLWGKNLIKRALATKDNSLSRCSSSCSAQALRASANSEATSDFCGSFS
ncbi:hypothetical protein SAMN04487867_13834, partial [Vreelandella titanicae]